MPEPLRVLVVDDNVDHATVLAELLRLMGHVTESVTDSTVALTAARRFKPHVALLDIGMPVLDGYQLATALRAEFGEKLLLVAVSGYGSAEHRKRSGQAGFDAHLGKTVDIETLQAVFARLGPKSGP